MREHALRQAEAAHSCEYNISKVYDSIKHFQQTYSLAGISDLGTTDGKGVSKGDTAVGEVELTGGRGVLSNCVPGGGRAAPTIFTAVFLSLRAPETAAGCTAKLLRAS